MGPNPLQQRKSLLCIAGLERKPRAGLGYGQLPNKRVFWVTLLEICKHLGSVLLLIAES